MATVVFSEPKGRVGYAEGGYRIVISEQEYQERRARGRRAKAKRVIGLIVAYILVALAVLFVCMTLALLVIWKAG